MRVFDHLIEQVDGVFDCDPKKNAHAKLHQHLTYQDVVVKQAR